VNTGRKSAAAEASVADARAQLTMLSRRVSARLKQGTLVNRDQINSARARYVQQQQDIARYTNLVKEEAATGADLEAGKSTLRCGRKRLQCRAEMA
jgi:membrane fusion protein (multidrug efflux system)